MPCSKLYNLTLYTDPVLMLMNLKTQTASIKVTTESRTLQAFNTAKGADYRSITKSPGKKGKRRCIQRLFALHLKQY